MSHYTCIIILSLHYVIILLFVIGHYKYFNSSSAGIDFTRQILTFNPLTAKLFNLNFHPLEVVSR